MDLKHNLGVGKAVITMTPNQKPKRKIFDLFTYKFIMATANNIVSRVRTQPTGEIYFQHIKQKTYFFNTQELE